MRYQYPRDISEAQDTTLQIAIPNSNSSFSLVLFHTRFIGLLYPFMNAIATIANAKINLGLEVLHKRASDNFHEINTIFVRISLADRLVVSVGAADNVSGKQITVHCEPELVIPDNDNLVYKAAEAAQMLALEHGSGALPPVAIALQKHIPMGAGLGGGSSDAGAVLRAMATLWGNDALPAEELRAKAAAIGSDVPFFMENASCAVASGRGENVQVLDMQLPYHIVVVSPPIHVSTAWAYNALQRSIKADTQREPSNFPALLAEALAKPNLLRQYFKNDFEDVVFQEYPFLATIKSSLYDHDAVFALMTGSGSSVFGLFESNSEAQTIAAAVREEFPECMVNVCEAV
jgi:4-diphosphocytidyl-2-C-methyl-D-erythritol kinase